MPASSRSKEEKRLERLARRDRHVATFIATTSVLRSENIREYNALHKTVKTEMPNATVMQKWRNKQIVDAMWQCQRTWRLQAGAIAGAEVEALIKLLTSRYGTFAEAKRLGRIAVTFVSGKGDAQRRAVQTVAELGITRDMIEACAFELQSPNVMALDKMRVRSEQSIDQAEKRPMSSIRPGNRKKSGKVSSSKSDSESEEKESASGRVNGSLN
jgi:hypothetical protein